MKLGLLDLPERVLQLAKLLNKLQILNRILITIFLYMVLIVETRVYYCAHVRVYFVCAQHTTLCGDCGTM